MSIRVDHGPTQPGTLADLYASADLPRTLANLLGDLVWCDQSAAYVQDHDPARVYLTPSPHALQALERQKGSLSTQMIMLPKGDRSLK